MPESRRALLLHPVRLRIVQALAGRTSTPQELLDRLGDVPQATLYRHLNQLEDGGLIEIVDTRQVRGGTERTYRVVSSAVSLGRDDIADADRDELFRMFATFVGTLLTDYSAYLDSAAEIDFVADGVGFRQVPLWLDDEEFAAMALAINEAVEPFLSRVPAEARRRRLLSIVVMPDDR